MSNNFQNTDNTRIFTASGIYIDINIHLSIVNNETNFDVDIVVIWGRLNHCYPN